MTRDEIHKLPWEAQEHINNLERKLALLGVSKRSEQLPEFLMKDGGGKIVTAYIGGADVTEEWNKYLGNCG
tara:strand:+ start:49638 stop:49850 length:213 start_codon:yes stop_codon:yes gene_type:complete